MPGKKTNDEFIEEMKYLRPEVEVLGEYINSKNPILCRCLVSNVVWNPTPDALLHGKRCRICATNSRRNKRMKPHDVFIQEMNVKQPNMIVNGRYDGAWRKIECTCNICGVTDLYYPANLLYDGGCWTCGNRKISEKLSMPLEVFLEKLRSVNQDIKYIDGYIKGSDHVNVQCLKCEHTWSPQAKSLLQGVGCPICCQSHGERAIDMYLHDNNILHKHQQKYDELLGVNGGNLSYDFYLFDYNILIEYQGQYHDGTVKIQTEAEFKIQQTHDLLKKEYANSYDIKLVEIWYWDFKNINSILDEILK